MFAYIGMYTHITEYACIFIWMYNYIFICMLNRICVAFIDYSLACVLV